MYILEIFFKGENLCSSKWTCWALWHLHFRSRTCLVSVLYLVVMSIFWRCHMTYSRKGSH